MDLLGMQKALSSSTSATEPGMWQQTPVSTALGQEFKASRGYMVNLRSAWAPRAPAPG